MVRLDSLSVGRASLTMPLAILRMTVEKAGASMCRLGFFVPNKRPPGGRVGRGPCTRHEAHGLRTRPLRDFVAGAPTSRSACGGALNDEISHAERVFSLLLAGGALAHAMKLTAGGRGSFTFEGLYRSELLTAFKCKSPAQCAELHDVLRRGRDSNSWYGKPVRQFSKLVVSATHPPLRKCIPSRDSLTDFS